MRRRHPRLTMAAPAACAIQLRGQAATVAVPVSTGDVHAVPRDVFSRAGLAPPHETGETRDIEPGATAWQRLVATPIAAATDDGRIPSVSSRL